MKCLSSKDVLVIGISTNHKPLSMLCHNTLPLGCHIQAEGKQIHEMPYSARPDATWTFRSYNSCKPTRRLNEKRSLDAPPEKRLTQYAHVYFDES